jgi:cation diffusion facilitator family transporter
MSDTHRRKAKVALLSVISNSSLVVFKLVVGVLTGSVAVISEAVHSGVDLLAAFIALFAVRESGKPADKEHQFGHGKVESVSGAIEAALIFLAAGWIIYEAIDKLIHPEAIEFLGWGILVMAISGVVNVVVSNRLFRVGKETESMALLADAWHLRTDVYTSFGVMVGLGLVWLGGRFWPEVSLMWLDPAVAIVVALLILRVAIRLTLEAVRDLVDSSLPEQELLWISTYFLELRPTVLSFHRIRTRKSGSMRFIDLHVVVEPSMTIEQSHMLSHRIEDEIKAHFISSSTIVHVEPCDDNCKEECLENCYKQE